VSRCGRSLCVLTIKFFLPASHGGGNRWAACQVGDAITEGSGNLEFTSASGASVSDMGWLRLVGSSKL